MAGHGPYVWQALIEEDVWVVTDGGGSLGAGRRRVRGSLFLACPFICFFNYVSPQQKLLICRCAAILRE